MKISDVERENINAGIESIRRVIEALSAMRILYSQKRDVLLALSQSRNSNNDFERQFTQFLSYGMKLDELKKYFAQLPEIPEEVSSQYKTFLQSVITGFNIDNLHLLNDFNRNSISGFLNRQSSSETLDIKVDDNNYINWTLSAPSQYVSYIKRLSDTQSKLSIFDSIKNIHGSIVMIGANGSGKSTFARQLKGKLSDNISILSSQNLLYYRKNESIPAAGDEINKVRDFQQNNKLSSDSNIVNLITSDMDNLIAALRAEHTDRTYDTHNGKPKQQSYLEKTADIWKEIIVHRHLIIKRTGITVGGDGISEYDFNFLSDGEKAVFYYVAHVLLAKLNSYIIVDEPENHLHASICNKLWDRLEAERPDCKFIYLTHDLNFATSRSNCTILWNKRFVPPYDWDYIELPKDDTIPEVLIMELVGSRNDVCFVESEDRSKLDYKLYSVLFSQYTVIPVQGHDNVVSYTRAYNSVDSFKTRAVGIIDGDYHLKEQIDKWKKLHVYVLKVNEVENILCDEEIIKEAIKHFYSQYTLDDFKNAFWEIINESGCKERLAATYIQGVINDYFRRKLINATSGIDKIKKEIQENIVSSQY